MNDIIKFILRTFLVGIVWTFVLSITWQGRPIFYYANELLVQNEIVSSADRSLAQAWQRLTVAAKATWNEPDQAKESVSF